MSLRWAIALFALGSAGIAGAVYGGLPGPWALALLGLGLACWAGLALWTLLDRMRRARALLVETRRAETDLRKDWLRREMLGDASSESATRDQS